MRSILAGAFIALFSSQIAPVAAAEIKSLALGDGTRIDYALVLPQNFRLDRDYPAILAFPGGRQSIAGVGENLERFWEAEAAKRGFIVVSPAAPPGKPFFEAGAGLVPEFLSRAAGGYRIRGGKFHVAGHSNGAVSAFRVAVRYPELFRSVIVLAGFPESQEDFDRLDRLKELDVVMFVGDGDLYWKEGMVRTRAKLKTLEIKADLEILPRNGHLFPDLRYENAWKIFAHIKE